MKGRRNDISSMFLIPQRIYKNIMPLVKEDSEKTEELELMNASKNDNNYIENAIQYNQRQEEQRQKIRQSGDIPTGPSGNALMDATSTTAPLPPTRGTTAPALPPIAESETIPPRVITQPRIVVTGQSVPPTAPTVTEQQAPWTPSTPPFTVAGQKVLLTENAAATTSTPVVQPGAALNTPSVSSLSAPATPTISPERPKSRSRPKLKDPKTRARLKAKKTSPLVTSPLSGKVRRTKDQIETVKKTVLGRSLLTPTSRGKYRCSYKDCGKEYDKPTDYATHLIDSHLKDMSDYDRESVLLFTPPPSKTPPYVSPHESRRSKVPSQTKSAQAADTEKRKGSGSGSRGKQAGGQYPTDFERYTKGPQRKSSRIPKKPDKFSPS